MKQRVIALILLACMLLTACSGRSFLLPHELTEPTEPSTGPTQEPSTPIVTIPAPTVPTEATAGTEHPVTEGALAGYNTKCNT